MAAAAQGGPPVGGDDRALRDLVHDLRTPVAIIEGFADLLESRGDELPAEQRADYVARVAAAARELRERLDRA